MTMTFPNEGTWDRALRLVIGLALLYAGWRLWSGPLAIGALAVGAIAVITGAIGWCPAYSLFGCSTRHGKA
jgi:hypothetical protein